MRRTSSLSRTSVIAACFFAALAGNAWGQSPGKNYGQDYEEEKIWGEVEVPLPEYPQAGSLIEFYVSATASNQFFVDAKSVSVGTDGVVRYALVIKTRGGATNVSFEGIRCQTRERKIYAFGHSDGNWAKARDGTWSAIQGGGANNYQAALWWEYFCPGGSIINSAKEGVAALKRGSALAR
jgi:hypothetical protein